MFDLGLALSVVVALVIGSVTKKTPRSAQEPVGVAGRARGLPAEHPRQHRQRGVGRLAFLALFRTASWDGFKERPAARAAVLGLLAAAACTLRQSYLIPVAVFMVVFYCAERDRGDSRRGHGRRENLVIVGVAAGTLLLFLLPWMILSYRSDRTLLFPC